MRKLVSLMFGLSLAFASPAPAADTAASAQAALEVCLENFPNLKGVKGALEADGWDFRGGGNYDLYVYVRDGLRGVVAHTMVNAPKKGCFVSASKMSKDFALAMAGAVAARMQNVEETGPFQDFENGWYGTLNGKPVVVAVLKKFDLGFMRGAAVVFMEP